MVTKSSQIGRPRAFDPIEVADAAVDVFWRRGYAGATTRVLEAELDLTQSSIYNTFGSKSGLMDAALERYEERFAEALLASLSLPERQGAAAIDEFLDAIVAWVGDPDRPGCLMVNGLIDAAADIRVVARVEEFRSRLHALLLENFRAAGANAADADHRAGAAVMGVFGLATIARAGVDLRELRAAADSLRTTLAPPGDRTTA